MEVHFQPGTVVEVVCMPDGKHRWEAHPNNKLQGSVNDILLKEVPEDNIFQVIYSLIDTI